MWPLRDQLWLVMTQPHPNDCVCAFCSIDKEFSFPEYLIDKIANGEVVLFVGAGISTENKAHCQSTFYEEIRADLKSTGDLSFPKLMDAYCSRPDGRIKLLEKIKHRFDYFLSFDDFIRPMTRFPLELSRRLNSCPSTDSENEENWRISFNDRRSRSRPRLRAQH